MRIVIGGDEDVALRLAEELMAGHDVVLLCGEHASPARLERLDVETVGGSIASLDALERAGAGSADFFVACAGEDDRNLVACVWARRLGCPHTICFVRRPEYARAAGEDEGSMAEAFGIDTVIRPARRLAHEIVRIIGVPGALDVEILEEGRVRLRKYAVEPDATAAGRTVREAGIPPGVVLVGVRSGDAFSLPRGDTRLAPGAKVLAMGDARGLDRLAAMLLRPGATRTPGGAVTIVGGGVVGQTVAAGLADAGGYAVKVIESDSTRCEELARTLPEALVLCGNGADLDLLESERIDQSRVLVAVTDNDEKNLLVSLLGRQLGIGRIVTRASSISNERLFERVGIDVVRSARGSSIRAVLERIDGGRSELRAELEHGEARIVQMTVPAAWRPVTLDRLHLPVFAIIGAISRGGATIIPRGTDELRGGDRILVFCERDSETAMRAFLSRPLDAEA